MAEQSLPDGSEATPNTFIVKGLMQNIRSFLQGDMDEEGFKSSESVKALIAGEFAGCSSVDVNM